MNRAALILLALSFAAPPLLAQQPKTADERAVWALIESSATAEPKMMDDIVFVSGAYPKPMIGRNAIDPRDSSMANADTAMRRRSAVVQAVHPQRVVVSRSGDMAYGFALFDMKFDQPDTAGHIEHVSFSGSQLTVWRRVGGEWRLAASFNRPNE
ncbi:MAG: hypothetical protein ACTHM9_10165 [Gemmatimonadales bacterium]